MLAHSRENAADPWGYSLHGSSFSSIEQRPSVVRKWTHRPTPLRCLHGTFGCAYLVIFPKKNPRPLRSAVFFISTQPEMSACGNGIQPCAHARLEHLEFTLWPAGDKQPQGGNQRLRVEESHFNPEFHPEEARRPQSSVRSLLTLLPTSLVETHALGPSWLRQQVSWQV